MSVGPSVCARQSENSTVQLSVQRLSRGQTPVRRTDACTLPRKWTVQRLSRVDCAEDRRVHPAEEVDCAAPERRTDACTMPRKWTVQRLSGGQTRAPCRGSGLCRAACATDAGTLMRGSAVPVQRTGVSMAGNAGMPPRTDELGAKGQTHAVAQGTPDARGGHGSCAR